MFTRFLLTLFLVTSPLQAANLTLSWDPAPADHAVISYNVYEVTPTSRVKLGNVAGTTEFTIQNVVPAVRTYEITMVNLWGESVPWAAGTTPPPLPDVPVPHLLKFKVTLQTSTDSKTWTTVATYKTEAPQVYARATVEAIQSKP